VYIKQQYQGFVLYLESGDSLPLSARFDNARMQLKMIDQSVLDKRGNLAPSDPFDE